MKKKLLFIDSCITRHESRTKKLCETYIEEFLKKNPDYELETVTLKNGEVKPLTMETLAEREGYEEKEDWNHDIFRFAKQYKSADRIVLGTPYWELSFTSIVKVYVENVMIGHLTFRQTENGCEGLCSAEKITYITTSGGYIGDKNYGYDYIKGIAEMSGIPKTEFFSAEGLDIYGNDADAIVSEAICRIKDSFK